MDIVRVNFGSLGEGGDNGTSAIVKLDHDVQELADAITDADDAATALTTRVTAVEGKATDLDARVTAAKTAADNAQSTASAAMPKAGGEFTGPVKGTSITASGNITSTTGSVVVVQSILSTTPNMIVATGSAGTIYFRPNGVGSTVGEGRVDSAGGLTLAGGLSTGALVRSTGTQCRSGISGAFGANSFNVLWASSVPYLYIDATNVGNIQVNSSDYRIKDRIREIAGGDLEKVMRWRPVAWRYRDIEGTAWRDDGRWHRSFIAHELQAVDETLVIGKKDAVDAEGQIIPQQLEPLAMLSQVTGALQELKHEVDALRARVADLETR